MGATGFEVGGTGDWGGGAIIEGLAVLGWGTDGAGGQTGKGGGKLEDDDVAYAEVFAAAGKFVGTVNVLGNKARPGKKSWVEGTGNIFRPRGMRRLVGS